MYVTQQCWGKTFYLWYFKCVLVSIFIQIRMGFFIVPALHIMVSNRSSISKLTEYVYCRIYDIFTVRKGCVYYVWVLIYFYEYIYNAIVVMYKTLQHLCLWYHHGYVYGSTEVVYILGWSFPWFHNIYVYTIVVMSMTHP